MNDNMRKVEYWVICIHGDHAVCLGLRIVEKGFATRQSAQAVADAYNANCNSK